MNSHIGKILEVGETETAEFKPPRTTRESLTQSVCALLNQRGGMVVWGVTDKRNPIGIPNAEQAAKELNDHVMGHIRPRPLISVSIEPVGAQQLVVVDVPPGADKPYSVDRQIWIRIARHTLRASADESSEIVERNSIQLERWERETMPDFALEDCSVEELSRARADIVQAGRFGIDVPLMDVDLLRQLHLAKAGQLTNGSVVLFAREPRRWAPNLSLRIVFFAGPHKGQIDSDTILERPAVALVQEAVAIIQQRTGFSSSFQAAKIQRADRPAYPLFALREGLVNAIVHRDYRELGDVQVELYPDSIVIRNPGTLPEGITIADLNKEHISKPVNPDIARVFYLRRYMEQLGMGTRQLIAHCKEVGARLPRWTESQRTVSLQIFRAPTSSQLSPRQATFTEQHKAGYKFNLRTYARFADVSERQARRDLQELERLGLVQRVGKGPATTYRLRPAPGDLDAARDAAVARHRENAPTKDRDAVKSVDAMVRWFFERYEDPANSVPYGGREGGYQYVLGGPYNAEVELREVFDDGSKRRDRMIRDAIGQILGHGYEWVKRGEY